ncbi:MAG: TrkH family potassium uptake protein, partial [Acidothermales bacterium]|nr:TrkH family potassium uptake protein [Acidothermales bacterium]
MSWRPRHPAQVLVVAFAVAVLASTALLMLPASTASGDGAPLVTALFTATSAVCVTGLVVVDTGTYWSGFGRAVILGSFQIGGFGIMTLASLLGLVVSRRLGLRTRLLAQAETKALSLGDVRQVIRGVAVISFTIETLIAAALVIRLLLAYDMSPAAAAYEGVFHAVSAFNNAGFVLYADSLTRYVTDPWVSMPVAIGVALGSLGFPVLFELRRELRSPRLWSLHTKITLATTALLLVGGTAFITAFEWTNPATLGPLDVPGKLLAGWFQGAMPRSGGFNTVDYSQMNEPSWLVTDVLMFIGGGSASTAGGIKVTTFMVLFFSIVAEARGDST